MPSPDTTARPSSRDPAGLHLDVISPSGTLISCAVDSVIIPAWDGLMGILPGHAPLLAMLRPGTASARIGDKTCAYRVTGGFADVGPTHVRLIADSAEPSP